MDLTEQIATKINSMDNMPFLCVINYLTDNKGMAIYPIVGSSTEVADWAGNLTKNINYEVQIRGATADSAEMSGTLWRIANMLDSIDDIKSKNGSYIFQNLTITSEPSLTDADANGHVQYTLGFTVKVFQTKGMLNND